MLPDSELVSLEQEIPFFVPLREHVLIDYEMGGKAKDTIYTAEWLDGTLSMTNTQTNQKQVLMSDLQDVERIGLAFDVLNKPFFCYVQNGTTQLHWVKNGQSQVMNFGQDVQFACITYDDIRPLQKDLADVVFAYVRNQKLCVRYQRESFATEHQLADFVRGQLWQIGLTTSYRFRFTSRYLMYR